MAGMRIGIGSIFQESNQFAATQTDLSLFRNSYVHEGDALLQLAGTDCEVAGILATCVRCRRAGSSRCWRRAVSRGERCRMPATPS